MPFVGPVLGILLLVLATSANGARGALPDGLEAAIADVQRAMIPCPEGYLARHSGNDQHYRFNDGALTVSPSGAATGADACNRDGTNGVRAPWRWVLRLVGYGVPGRTPAVADAAPQVDGHRLAMRRGALVEWYENRQEGLKQGFTLLEPPFEGATQLVLRLAVGGGLIPRWDRPSQALAFHRRSGEYALSYRDLAAFDAAGRALPADFALVSGAVEIHVDALDAVWPITVDPVVFNEQRVTSHSGAAGDFFGWSVAVSGNTAVVGAWLDDERGRDAGAAYVFVRSGRVWRLQSKLMSKDAAAGDFFGAAVAVEGDRVLVGAPLGGDDAYFAGDSGAAYLFERRGSSWRQQQKLTTANGASGDLFGRAVALSADTAAVGAYGDRDKGVNSGAVYLFEHSAQGWGQPIKLTAEDGNTDDRFGASLSLAGDNLLVGAYRDDSRGEDSGSAYVFARADQGWQQQAKLTADDGSEQAFFGFSVALSGDTALIGAWRDDGKVVDGGAAYLFERKKGKWRQRQKLTGEAANGHFGFAVALEGSFALVGAYLDGSHASAAGAAYLYERSSGRLRPRATWTGEAKDDGFGIAVALADQTALVAAVIDGEVQNPGTVHVYELANGEWQRAAHLSAPAERVGDRFGAALALSDRYALIGAPKADTAVAEVSGAAYLFRREAESLGEHQVLWAADGAIGDSFGRGVATSGERVLIGAPRADAGGSETGVVYVFSEQKGRWLEQAQLTAKNGGVRSAFGQVIVLDGDRALVGAPGDSEAAPGAGAAYLFTRQAGRWTLQEKLMAEDAAPDQQFGSALALHGDRALIGAYRDRTRGRLAGAAYLFERTGDGWAQRQKLLPVDGAALQYFGFSVALGDELALVGAWGDGENGRQAGALYLFAPAESGWRERAKLMPAPAGSRLGVSLSLSGSTALAGAYSADEVSEHLGAAYVFSRSGQEWKPQAKLTTVEASPSYGLAVTLDGDAALIASALADETGAVSFFHILIDDDGDSIPDGVDNCPTVANPEQEDTDGNAVGDACEPQAEPDAGIEAVMATPDVGEAGATAE